LKFKSNINLQNGEHIRMKATRREFIKKAGFSAACVCTGMAAIKGCSMIGGISMTPEISPDAWQIEDGNLVIDPAMVNSLKNPGGSGKLTIGDQIDGEGAKIIVIHHKEGEFKAFADCCTHGCRELNYLHDKEQLECSSFGKSAFTLKGKAIKGPAEDPLKTYSLQTTDGKIIIKIT
jgi:nitrite reductase/ring-hydroxylating ferredoxin subunit